MDPADSTQGITLELANNNLLDSKALTGSMLMSSQDSCSLDASTGQMGKISSVVVPDTLPAWIDNMPFSDWEIDVADVVIGLRPDGRKWELGAGAFSRVSPASIQICACSMCQHLLRQKLSPVPCMHCFHTTYCTA